MTRWFAGSDHAGRVLKDHLVSVLRELGDDVTDLGTNSCESVDYPDFGSAVGRAIADAKDTALGLVVCGSGLGIVMAANKVPGVRAATVHDAYTAEKSRQHNNANVIGFGERVTGAGVAEEALVIFRNTEFAGGRHQHRVDKLTALDR